MTEFELIKRYFAIQTEHRSDVRHGIGDDAALVSVPLNHELVITTDTLVEGIHFPKATLPYDIGYKALAVNLSDLAAMGATPAWVTLALTLPSANENWIQEFCEGFFTLANRYQVQLIGGDLTRGPLSITVQAMGFTPTSEALLRSTAQVNDLIYVTGTLGDAGLGLKAIQHLLAIPEQYQRYIFERFNRPTPRIETGIHLRGLAHAAIDISDGLAADLNHILRASKVGASVNVDQLPLSEALQKSLPLDNAIELALTGGDDYELCFTVSPEKREALENTLATLACRFTCIGSITAHHELHLHHQNGNLYHGSLHGYRHF